MSRIILCLWVVLHGLYAQAADPLPSWNGGQAKAQVTAFISAVSDKDNSRFVPVAERIAVFDMDGTLMLEKPTFLQALFLDDRVRRHVSQKPSLAEDPIYKAFLTRESWGAYFARTPLENTLKLYFDTHTGMSQEAFSRTVRDFMRPFYNRSLVYKPMRELLDYLRAKQFKIYLVTGSETQFARVFAQAFFGIPPEQVIGSSWKSELKEVDGRLVVMRLPEMHIYNDKRQKVIEIQERIGRIPVFAAGNDGNSGDIAMLRYTTQSGGFGMVIAHDDPVRERAYTDKDGMTQRAAARFGWTVVHVKDDWKTLF